MRVEPLPRADKEISMNQTAPSRFIPRKILVPLDFSPSSDTALEVAADLAQHFQAALHLVHVVPMLLMNTGGEFSYGSQQFDDAALLRTLTADAEQRIAPCVAAMVSRGIETGSSIEVGNDVPGNIMIVIEREHVDMVVISTHGVSGWRPIVFGSIAEKIVKLVRCPLLLLRSVSPDKPPQAPRDSPNS
jgi:nucleotide-binding universal stress UspA family protein